MEIIIDTHALLWFYEGSPDLSKNIKEIILDNTNLCYLSIGSLLILNQLEDYYKDPFDRILIAQSKVIDLPIATKDELIKKYPVKTIW